MNNTLEPPSTPPSQRLPIDLSPPDSQGGIPLQASSSLFNNVPTLPSGLSGANMNGKRPLDTLDGNVDSVLTAAPDTTCSIDDGLNGQTLPQGQTKTHPGSGYTWRRTEDAPGYSWQNRKAQDEATRAWENGIVNKDRSVGSGCLLTPHMSASLANPQTQNDTPIPWTWSRTSSPFSLARILWIKFPVLDLLHSKSESRFLPSTMSMTNSWDRQKVRKPSIWRPRLLMLWGRPMVGDSNPLPDKREGQAMQMKRTTGQPRGCTCRGARLAGKFWWRRCIWTGPRRTTENDSEFTTERSGVPRRESSIFHTAELY